MVENGCSVGLKIMRKFCSSLLEFAIVGLQILLTMEDYLFGRAASCLKECLYRFCTGFVMVFYWLNLFFTGFRAIRAFLGFLAVSEQQ